MVKSFQIEQYDGNKLHLMVDGWTMFGDADMCKRELDKWLDKCNGNQVKHIKEEVRCNY